MRPSLIAVALQRDDLGRRLQRVADRRQAAQHQAAVEEVADDALGRQRRLADRDVADEHRMGEAAPGDLLGQRRVERERAGGRRRSTGAGRRVPRSASSPGTRRRCRRPTAAPSTGRRRARRRWRSWAVHSCWILAVGGARSRDTGAGRWGRWRRKYHGSALDGIAARNFNVSPATSGSCGSSIDAVAAERRRAAVDGAPAAAAAAASVAASDGPRSGCSRRVHADARRRPRARRLVLAGLVEVQQRGERAGRARRRRVGEQRRLVELAHAEQREQVAAWRGGPAR